MQLDITMNENEKYHLKQAIYKLEDAKEYLDSQGDQNNYFGSYTVVKFDKRELDALLSLIKSLSEPHRCSIAVDKRQYDMLARKLMTEDRIRREFAFQLAENISKELKIVEVTSLEDCRLGLVRFETTIRYNCE